MQNKEKDFLLFYDWFKIIEKMSHKHGHMLICAMVRYQADGTEPPEFPDKIRDAADLMFAQLRRRMSNMENGRRGAEARIRELVRKSAEEEKAAKLASSPLGAHPQAPLKL